MLQFEQIELNFTSLINFKEPPLPFSADESENIELLLPILKTRDESTIRVMYSNMQNPKCILADYNIITDKIPNHDLLNEMPLIKGISIHGSDLKLIKEGTLDSEHNTDDLDLLENPMDLVGYMELDDKMSAELKDRQAFINKQNIYRNENKNISGQGSSKPEHNIRRELYFLTKRFNSFSQKTNLILSNIKRKFKVEGCLNLDS